MKDFKEDFNSLLLTNNNIKSLYNNAIALNYDLSQLLQDNHIKSYSVIYYSQDLSNNVYNQAKSLFIDLDKVIKALNYNFKKLDLAYWVKYSFTGGLKFYGLTELVL